MTRRRRLQGWVAVLVAGCVAWWLASGSPVAVTDQAPAPGRALLPVQRDGRWGVIDAQGQLLLQPRYEALALYAAVRRAAFGAELDALPVLAADAVAVLKRGVDEPPGLRARLPSEPPACTWIVTRERHRRLALQRHWPFVQRREAVVETLWDSSGRRYASGPIGAMLDQMVPTDPTPGSHESLLNREHAYVFLERPGVGRPFPTLHLADGAYLVRPEGLRRLPPLPPDTAYVSDFADGRYWLPRGAGDSPHEHQRVSLFAADAQELSTSELATEWEWEMTIIRVNAQPEFKLAPNAVGSPAQAAWTVDSDESGEHFTLRSRRSGAALPLVAPGYKRHQYEDNFDFLEMTDFGLYNSSTAFIADSPDHRDRLAIAYHPDFVAICCQGKLTVRDHDLRLILERPVRENTSPIWHGDAGGHPSLEVVYQVNKTAYFRLVWDLDAAVPQSGLYTGEIRAELRVLDAGHGEMGLFDPARGDWILPPGERRVEVRSRIRGGWWIWLGKDRTTAFLREADGGITTLDAVGLPPHVSEAAMTDDGSAFALLAHRDDGDALLYPPGGEALRVPHGFELVHSFRMPVDPRRPERRWVVLVQRLYLDDASPDPDPSLWTDEFSSRRIIGRYYRRLALYDPGTGALHPEPYAAIMSLRLADATDLIYLETFDGRHGYLRPDGTWLWPLQK